MTTALKSKAFDIAYSLYNGDALSSTDYEAIRDGLEEIETIIKAHNTKGPQSEMAR